MRHTDTANRIATCSDSKRIRTRNTRKFTGVKLIHGFSPQVSRGGALKSFQMLLDRRQRLFLTTCERFVHHPAVVDVMCLSFHNL